MNADNTNDFKAVIEVEADRTCSVKAPSINILFMGHGSKITGLSPEQATCLKNALESAFACGRARTLQKLHQDIERELCRA